MKNNWQYIYKNKHFGKYYINNIKIINDEN